MDKDVEDLFRQPICPHDATPLTEERRHDGDTEVVILVCPTCSWECEQTKEE